MVVLCNFTIPDILTGTVFIADVGGVGDADDDHVHHYELYAWNDENSVLL